MKRWVVVSLIGVLILGLFSWGGYYVFWTPGGVRWAFKALSHFSPLTLSAEKIEGRITGSLYLEGVKAVWADGNLKIRKVQTRLKALHLLRGGIVFEEIAISGISVEDQKKRTEPLDLSLPKIGGLLASINLEVRSFNLKEITYLNPVDRPRIIEVLSGRLSWRQGMLAVSPILVKGDFGRLEGALGLGFSMPAIGVDIHWVPAKPWKGLDQLIIQSQLTPSWSPNELSGPISIQGRAGNSNGIFFQAGLRITAHRIDFQKVALREANRKGSVSGQGTVIFDRTGPAFRTLLRLDDLDLSKESSTVLIMSGQILLTGRPDEYSGSFELMNKVRSWQAFRLDGTLQGKQTGLELRVVKGEWLKGVLNGRLGITLGEEISVQGFLKGRQLRPEIIHPHWSGVVNLDAQGVFYRSFSGLNRGSLAIELLESQFQEKNLQGIMKASWEKNDLLIEKAELRGRGFRLSGQGVLSRHFDFETQVSDLSSLVPNSRGSFSSSGWVRWRKDRLSGRLALEGKELYWTGKRIKELKLGAAVDQEKLDTDLDLKVQIQRLVSGSLTADSLVGEAKGTLAQHKIDLSLNSSQGKIQAGLIGFYGQKHWKGLVSSLSGAISQGKALRLLSPAALQVGLDRFQLSSMVLEGQKGERISLTADLGLNPVIGNFSAEWQKIDLARSRPYLKKVQITGQTSGWVRGSIFRNNRMDLQAGADLEGVFQTEGRRVELTRGGLRLAWDESGMRSSWKLETKDGARIWGEASSQEKGRFAFPDQGRLSLTGEGIDLELINPGKNPGLQASGKIRGQLQGGWTDGPRFALKGRLGVVNGALSWQEKGTVINSLVKSSDVEIMWYDDKLHGDINLELESYGRVSGAFNLPLSTRIPLKIKSDGPFNLNLSGDVREHGLLTSLFPEAVQTSRGRIHWNLSAKGTWGKPALEGDLELTEAGIDILPLGIRVQNISAKAAFNQDQINLSSLEMHSGPGQLNGRAIFWLKDWKIARLEGKLSGNHFQIINRPGIEAQANPDLDLSGSPEHLNLKGVLEIPEALLSGGQPTGAKQASPDVIIMDPSASPRSGTDWPIYGEIRLLMGQQVRLKAEGLEASLQGSVSVGLNGSKSIKAHGEIQVARGFYLLQNQKLEISRGRFVFNGPPGNPTLDLLALRTIRGHQGLQEWVEEVKAGITVTGPLLSPVVKLYSRPLLSESDILSYILFGEPLKQGSEKQDPALMSKAAKILLGGKTAGKLGGLLDTMEVKSGTGDFSHSVITVGKYVDPRLFLGVGGSLFDNSYQAILRYALTPHLEIESRGGTHSSGGIFFKIDFE